MNQHIHWIKVVVLLVVVFTVAALFYCVGKNSVSPQIVQVVGQQLKDSKKNEEGQKSIAYKKAFLNGDIPATWSEYSNGYLVEPIDDKTAIERGEKYIQNLLASIGEDTIDVSDIPYNRLDIFEITPSLQQKLIDDWKKQGRYSQEKIGNNTFDVITFDKTESDEYSQGEIFRAYFLSLGKRSDGVEERALFSELGADAQFDESIQHYLSTISLNQ